MRDAGKLIQGRLFLTFDRLRKGALQIVMNIFGRPAFVGDQRRLGHSFQLALRIANHRVIFWILEQNNHFAKRRLLVKSCFKKMLLTLLYASLSSSRHRHALLVAEGKV